MKKRWALLSGFLALLNLSFACTTFLLQHNGQLVFGRNYDWVTGSGMVCTNLRGLAKTSIKTTDGETISWVSKYGSISFNQYGKEFPTGGMNEKGLVVELMMLDGTQYPEPDTRPAVGGLQWIQYQLDNCSSVEELIATDKQLRIASKGTVPLHFLVADADGNAATIEFLNGKMTVHRGKDLPFPVLTNDRYDFALKTTGAATGRSESQPPFSRSSLQRFAKACDRLKKLDPKNNGESVIDYSFSILQDVAQGTHTKWSIVYDIARKKIYFKSLDAPEVKSIAFSSFDLDCTSGSKARDINQPGKGDVAESFVDFTPELNKEMVSRSFMESGSQIRISEARKQETWEYPGTVYCKKVAKSAQN